MKYCRYCLIPNTKPHVVFDAEGICSACRAHKNKNAAVAGINWEERRADFETLLADIKKKKAPLFDVLVPVSGGKDSITQVHRVLGRHLRVLTVNIDYGIKTEIGHFNLSLIPKMGANLFVYTPAQPLHRRLIRIGFMDFGDPDLLSHTLLHAMPLRLAIRLEIPLVLLGENSAFEYGGDISIAQNPEITHEWFLKFAANNGRDALNISKTYGIPYSDLMPYDYPVELESSPTKAIFMSHFFHWDSKRHLEIAQSHGFKSLNLPAEGTFRNYVGIDEKIHRIHQYFKVLKFGYGRATDHACEDIRNGRLSRHSAKQLVQKHDLQELGEPFIEAFIEYIDITRSEFDSVLNQYRNTKIWQRDNTDQWFIPGHLVDEVSNDLAEDR